MAENINKYIEKKLFDMQDLKYRSFHLKLMPGVDPESVIGVRTPELRKFSSEIFKREDKEEFLSDLPHKYYDENNLHGFVIEKIKDYDECVEKIDRFLPYVNNWATCDLMSPKVFKKHKDRLIADIKKWMSSSQTYTIRFGIEMLMSFFLNEDFKEDYLEMTADISSEEYYVNMMIAWFFATALAKQYESSLPYIENKKLEKWVHNKTIQKAVESRRITNEQKEYLKSLKIK
ncbi:MAG: DNA alkylation repair protein [Firmicutes bacterium]|nr:DNA alkylation repair protein [Bacillota bacterium]